MRAREIDAGIDPGQLAAGWRGRGVAWLDGDGIGAQGRWSFVGCEPVEVRVARMADGAPFAVLRDLGARGDAAPVLGIEPSIVPEWIGLITYDACWSAAATLGLRRGPRMARSSELQVARFARYDALVAVDREQRRAFLVGDDDAAIDRLEARMRALDPREGVLAPEGPDGSARSDCRSARPGGSARERARRVDGSDWSGRADAFSARTVGPGAGEPLMDPRPIRGMASDVVGEDAAVHRAAIERALEAIAAGEIYQVNLARRWTARFEGDAIALFLAMRAASPVPFGAYLEGDGEFVLARTMERFLRWDAGTRALSTRPIKGTIARVGGDDQAESATLRADPKERAEHAMIVDLMRNDLGRVAETGSVRVEGVMEVEPYAGLSHLVSTVRATTREGIDAEAILAATFPPGSITGTPKLRAIEIIEALERHPRGAYCGAIGHVDRAGGLSLAVAIRTATIANGALEYFAGGGLVEASVPEREVAETELKARVLLDAIAMLQRDARG